MSKIIAILPAEEADCAAIQQIYAPYVKDTVISLEDVPPNVEEIKARLGWARDKGFPYIVAKIDGNVVGYAYATAYRARSAYRFTLEESVYVADGLKGAGIGQKLLSELMVLCRDKGYKQLVAVIAGSDNIASIKFHEALGFREAGRLQKVGFKFGQWVDTLIMQKEL